MKRNIKILLNFILISFLMSVSFFDIQSVLAAPIITDVSGTIVDGQQINISGTGFGIKDSVAPILWENFEDGIVGSALPTTGKWLARTGVGGYFNSDDKYSGSKSAYASMYNCQNTDCSLNTSYFSFTPTDEVYYSYYTKYKNTGGDNYGVWKNGRITTTESEFFYNKGGVMAISDSYAYAEKDSVSTDSAIKNAFNPDPYYTGPAPDYIKGTKLYGINWQRHEMYRKISNPAGMANGKVYARIDNDDSNSKWGNRSHDISNVVTRIIGEIWQQSDVLLGLMWENGHLNQQNEIWIDDVYVDNTQARIELCSGSTWSTRTHCEPQIPKTIWDNDNIMAIVNQGSLPDGQAYLFVIDENGMPSAGQAIVLGIDQSDTTAPSFPSSLNVQ